MQIYKKDIRTTFRTDDGWVDHATIVLQRAGLLEEYVGYICPNDTRIFYSTRANLASPEYLSCDLCEAEKRESIFRKEGLRTITFYVPK